MAKMKYQDVLDDLKNLPPQERQADVPISRLVEQNGSPKVVLDTTVGNIYLILRIAEKVQSLI